MADLTLYHGYPGVSSWSLRGWLAARKSGLDFDQVLIDYRRAEGKAKLAAISPNGLVPLLVHRVDRREVKVWESLAVCEYLAELAPAAGLWPADPEARALARSAASEMHAGFGNLRQALDMALGETREAELSDAVMSDIERIEAIWTLCRKTWGQRHGGPWLFGHFTIADAMYVPVATRFRTYGVATGDMATAYQAAVLKDPDFLVWEDMARQQPAPARAP